MANEYRIYWAGTETLALGDAAEARIYSVTPEVLASGDVPAAQFYAVVTESLVLGDVTYGQFHSAIIEVLADVAQGFFPSFYDELTLGYNPMFLEVYLPEFFDDPGTIFAPIYSDSFLPIFLDQPDLTFATLLPSFTEIYDSPPAEWNPYRPDLPNDLEDAQPDLHRYLQHQAETLRQQHNVNQAGDSTFGAWLIGQSTPRQLYTLGSLGRFYHESLGLILARYVQFTDWVETPEISAPVGIRASAQTVDWVVTNDFTKSNEDLVVGITFLSAAPTDGYFGWVVFEGANLYPLSRDGGDAPSSAAPLTWSDTGKVTIGSPGRIIGRHVGTGPDTDLIAAGKVYLRLEGPSPAEIGEIIDLHIVDLTAEVAAHETRLDTVESNITDLQTSNATLTSGFSALTLRVNLEEAARIRDIASIRSQLVTSGSWVAGDNTVRGEFALADDALRTLISLAQHDATNALTILSGLDVATLTTRLDSIEATSTSLLARLVNFTVNYPVPTAGDILIYDGIDSFVATQYVASTVPFTPYGSIAAADVQGAIQELADEKASLAGATFTGDVVIPDEAYGAGWDGSMEAPTKNALYDKIQTIAGGGVPSGSSFPGSPATNDLFFRTDRGFLYFYDGTRWLTVEERMLTFSTRENVTSDNYSYAAVPYKGVYDVYLTRFEAATFRSAAGEWDVVLQYRDSANVATTIITLDGNGSATNTWVSESGNVNAVLNSAAEVLSSYHDEISGTSGFYGGASAFYRLVG